MLGVDFRFPCGHPPPPAFSWVDLGQESGSAVKCGGGGGEEGGCGGEARFLPHCTHISQNLPGCPSVKPHQGVPYQELERTWPVAGSGENECTGGTVVLVFSPSIEGWFLMMGAEF